MLKVRTITLSVPCLEVGTTVKLVDDHEPGFKAGQRGRIIGRQIGYNEWSDEANEEVFPPETFVLYTLGNHPGERLWHSSCMFSDDEVEECDC